MVRFGYTSAGSLVNRIMSILTLATMLRVFYNVRCIQQGTQLSQRNRATLQIIFTHKVTKINYRAYIETYLRLNFVIVSHLALND